MLTKHKKPLPGNHLCTMVGRPFYKKKPSDNKALRAILLGLARGSESGVREFTGTAWSPVSHMTCGGYDVIYEQCPGACGQTFRFNIQDKDTANWIVNEINSLRWDEAYLQMRKQ